MEEALLKLFDHSKIPNERAAFPISSMHQTILSFSLEIVSVSIIIGLFGLALNLNQIFLIQLINKT